GRLIARSDLRDKFRRDRQLVLGVEFPSGNERTFAPTEIEFRLVDLGKPAVVEKVSEEQKEAFYLDGRAIGQEFLHQRRSQGGKPFHEEPCFLQRLRLWGEVQRFEHGSLRSGYPDGEAPRVVVRQADRIGLGVKQPGSEVANGPGP